MGTHKPFFKLEKFHITVEKNSSGKMISQAMVKLIVNNQSEHTVSEGDGPVDALYSALSKSLERFFPNIREMHLIDYKVRIVNPAAGTAAITRVVIETRDKDAIWGTVGVSENVIEASWQALVDSVEYKLIKDDKAAQNVR
jgi:2-isopropylmalate synthase